MEDIYRSTDIEAKGPVRIDAAGFSTLSLGYSGGSWFLRYEAIESFLWHISIAYGLGGNLVTEALTELGHQAAPFAASVLQDQIGAEVFPEGMNLVVSDSISVIGGSAMKSGRVQDLALDRRATLLRAIDPSSPFYVLGPSLQIHNRVRHMDLNQLPETSLATHDWAIWLNYAVRHEADGWQQRDSRTPGWVEGQHRSGASAVISPNESRSKLSSHRLTYSTPGGKITGRLFTPGYPLPEQVPYLAVEGIPRPGTDQRTSVIPISKHVGVTGKGRTR